MDTLLIAYWLLGDNHFSKDLYTTVLVQGLFLDHQILEGFGYNTSRIWKQSQTAKIKIKANVTEHNNNKRILHGDGSEHTLP